MTLVAPGGRRAEEGSGPDVVAIGGGHGLAATLTAARLYAGRLTAVVSVADDGGSSGRLRRQFAIPAPGDLRRCLVAVAQPGSTWADAFEYRFPPAAGGDLEGHALGNLVIAALAGVSGDFGSALEHAARLLGARATVLPATVEAVDLAGRVAGVEVRGQVRIAEATGAVTDLAVVPGDARSPDEVVERILAADQVVIGPGSLYTSVLAACVAPDIHRALARRRSGRIYVCNLHPEVPETDGFTPGDHLRALADHGVTVDTMLCDGRWWERVGDGRESADLEVVHAELSHDVRGGHAPEMLAVALASLALGAPAGHDGGVDGDQVG